MMQNGQVTPGGLWLPGQRKAEGGSQFDDELSTADAQFVKDTKSLVEQINEREDHVVFVGSVEDRDKMRQVMNHFLNIKAIGRNVTIKIDYGIPEGGVRVREDR